MTNKFTFYLIWVILFFSNQKSIAQHPMEAFVKQNAVSIASIDPGATNFDDLLPLSEAIGDARVILLGEQDHGDARTFSAKTRLIKFLHEKYGFNVLAFEGDFYSLNEGWQSIQKVKSQIDPFIRQNVLHLWSDCENCRDLFYDYIPSSFQTANPLQLSGFDNQMFHKFATSHLMFSLDSLMSALDLQIAKETDYQTKIRPLFDSLINNLWYKAYQHKSISKQDMIQCENWLKVLKQQTAAKLDSGSFWIKVVDNLISQNRLIAVIRNPKKANQLRDDQMASNLEWLITTKYPKEKIIVWAANVHTQKSDMNGFNSMGSSSARLGKPPYLIKAPTKPSVESWINPEYPFAFIDYTQFNSQHPGSIAPFNQRGWMYQSTKKEWNKIYDGIFFIRTMEPCKKNNFLLDNSGMVLKEDVDVFKILSFVNMQ